MKADKGEGSFVTPTSTLARAAQTSLSLSLCLVSPEQEAMHLKLIATALSRDRRPRSQMRRVSFLSTGPAQDPDACPGLGSSLGRPAASPSPNPSRNPSAPPTPQMLHDNNVKLCHNMTVMQGGQT